MGEHGGKKPNFHACWQPPVPTLAPTVALADLAVRSATLLPYTCGYLGGAASAARGRAACEKVLQLHCR
jgi:hypothetical protein